MSAIRTDQLPKQADLLYLIFKYLETVPGFDSTSVALRDDIILNSSLGNTVGWDGAERVVDIDDIARNYPNVFSHQLSHLLQHSLSSVSTATNLKPSLLHQMVGLFNPSNASQAKRYSELSRKLVDITLKLRHMNTSTLKANHRIVHLEKILDINDVIPTILDEDFITEDVVPVLREVGRVKELAHLRSLLPPAESMCNLLKVEIDTLIEDMSHLGCMSSSINRGHVDGALNWLQSRELGMTSFGTGSGSALGRALVPSASSVRNKIMAQFRVLYTVSGHMMNPAYCCVFDQTGRYLLTGADDYLVKIWDVEKGQLIKTCKGHMGYISLVAVSPDNSLFASACTMGTIRIWRLSDGLCLQVFKHKAAVNWIKFDRTSCALASGSDDGQCIVWDLSKLLPEDAGEVPILDVILEDRAAALRAREEAGIPKPSREVDQLQINGEFVDNLVADCVEVCSDAATNQFLAATASSSSSAVPQRTSTSSSSSSTGYVPHAGEARLASAISNSDQVQYMGSNAWNHLAEGAGATNSALHAPIQHFNSRGGLFRWSGCVGADHQEDTDAMLVLHHIQDIMQANSDGDPLKVNCLDVSPMGNILVTGCEDGVARVWRIGDPEPIGAYTTRQPKLPLEGLLQKLKTIVSPSEYSRMKRVAAHLLMRLEGHVSPITDIHLNHLGDRVLTGSAQDCNVRIWSISRDLVKNVQVVLDLTEDEEDRGSAGGDAQQSRVRGGRNIRSRLKSQLYNACWTADSTKIVTIQSVVTGSASQAQSQGPNSGNASDRLPTRLKVWDAMTGDLLKVIWKISDICCRTLCKHPLNPSVVMTCGDDGFINVWDIDQEERLSSTRLFNDDKTPTKIVDASFSDDGSRLAVTDFLGRLSVLGLDDPERFNKVLSEQYFSTDYLDIMLDNAGFAIDVGTQMPVHEAPIGPLIRLDGTPYANQPAALKGPPAISKENIRKMLGEIAVDRKKSMKEMDRVFNTFTRNKARGRVPKKYRGNKPKALRALEEHNKLIEANDASNAPRRSHIEYIEFDVNNYNPSTEESEDSEFDLRNDREERAEPDISRRHNFGRSTSRRPRIATIRDTSRRSGRSRSQVDYNDDMEDNEYRGARDAVGSRAARANGREAQRRRQQLLHSDEFEDSDETEDSQDSANIVYSSDGENARTTRSRRSGSAGSDSIRPIRTKSNQRKARSARVIDDDDEGEGEGEVEVRETIPRPKKVKQQQPVFYRAKHGIVLGEGVEVGRKWLQTEEATPQYCPQIGDRVMYFPQGHIQWLQEFQESTSPPWMSFPQKWPVVECEVRAIQYMFPDTPQEHKMCCSVKAQVQLAVIRIPLRNGISHSQYILDMVVPRATRHSNGKEITFTVTLRDWDMPDFLIPSDLFLRSIRLAWHAGVRVTVQFKNYSEEEKGYVFKSYTGQIAAITNASPEWPQSPWDCIEVTWDDAAEGNGDGSSRVGPWEAVPQFSANSDYARILQTFPLAKIDTEEAERILKGIDELMESSEFADLFNPFAYPVDPAVFPSYYLSIAVPISVETIRNRLQSGYYRQLEALEFDVNLLYENCSNYNDEESPIVSAGAQLRAEFLKVIRPNGSVAKAVVEEAVSSSGRAEAQEEEPLTLRVRSTGSRSRSHQQNDSLVDVGGSPAQQRTRGGSRSEAASAPEETVLRLKRRREPSPEPSPVKSHRTSRNSVIREEPSQNLSKNSRSTRHSDSLAEVHARSSRSGRTHAKVNYTEPEEVEGDESEEEQGSEGENEENEGAEDEEGNSDEDDSESEEESAEPRASTRSSRYQTSSRSTRSKEQAPTNTRSSRSHRSSEPKHSKKSTRDKHHKNHRSDRSRRSSIGKSQQQSDEDGDDSSEVSGSGNEKSSAESSEVEEKREEQTMRSKRVIKAPANFANDMAAAMETEYEKHQQRQRAARPTPSQRYQQEQDRQKQEREQAAAQRSARRVDPEVKRQMLQVLGHAEDIDQEYNIFADPVTEDIAPGYFELIEHPVDLSTVRTNVTNRHYEAVSEVVADLEQMYANCELYNDSTSLLGVEAARQRADLKRFCHNFRFS